METHGHLKAPWNSMDGSEIPAAYCILLASSDRTCSCLSPWKGAGMLLERHRLILLDADLEYSGRSRLCS